MRQISATGNSRGFTLLELMLVVLIIGLLAVTVSLALPDSTRQLLERDGRRLYAQIGLAAEQAVYRNQDYGLRVNSQEYGFFRRQGETWTPVDPLSRLSAQPLAEGVRLSLAMGGQRLDLDQEQPQVLIVSDGQLSPFALSLSHPDVARTLQIEASFGGDLRLREVTP
ncbi:type II secretion system minor pseudopilin GspH [Motiliproteus sp. SC1-56]|uniref:type II secretion system minor pseudopilin GspH n=1 Tax=Motiliproteus sp. SC1-56 TaxID=2799565 RepID=UPI001A8EA776|nr:type II secretion system minor pseudopilin GspH [Motiliproteus sp. SC1-56]